MQTPDFLKRLCRRRRRGGTDDDEAKAARFARKAVGRQRRFETCVELHGKRNVVCMEPRLGTEMRALIDRDHFVGGLDLNPGPHNQGVMPDDFHGLGFADGSADAVYCNALDHVFDLERVVRKIARVPSPGGVFVAESRPAGAG